MQSGGPARNSSCSIMAIIIRNQIVAKLPSAAHTTIGPNSRRSSVSGVRDSAAGTRSVIPVWWVVMFISSHNGRPVHDPPMGPIWMGRTRRRLGAESADSAGKQGKMGSESGWQIATRVGSTETSSTSRPHSTSSCTLQGAKWGGILSARLSEARREIGDGGGVRLEPSTSR
jgi:hypothetical protein